MHWPSAVLVAGLTMMSGALPRIRYVPRVVDVHFASRLRLCPTAPARGGIHTSNGSRRSVGDFLGPGVREIVVHQIGDSLPAFRAVERHIRHVMAQRPQEFSEYSPWVEPTPLAHYGILGTLRYARGRSGRFEIAGTHLCAQDSAGRVWWARVGPVDVWP